MKLAIAVSVLVSFSVAAFGQSTPELEFEVASVKTAEPPAFGFTVRIRGGPGTDDPGLFRCENMSLSNLVRIAYNEKHTSMPDWMNTAMFNVDAKVPKGTTRDQFSVMLQNLLVSRFKLAVHHETREIPTYVLVVAKNGPKFKEAGAEKTVVEDKDEPPRPPTPEPVRLDKEGYPIFTPGKAQQVMAGNRARMSDPRMTMAELANSLGAQLHGPVTDATGLKGAYEITLYWTVDTMGATAETDSGTGLLESLANQLGLRVESKKGPVDFLVVDHAEKLPTEN
jgi:uncharacterized protein (TIGR03435 family)